MYTLFLALVTTLNVAVLWYSWRMNRSRPTVQRAMQEAMRELLTEQARVIAILALRLNPQGHVDIDKSEWDAGPEETWREASVMSHDGGIRILVR